MKLIASTLFLLLGLGLARGNNGMDDEIIITSFGTDEQCDNPLDGARVLVAIADFLEGYYANNGTAPDISTLPHDKSCDAKYYPCQAGGCCSGLTCMLTSNGLNRCVENDYVATLTQEGGKCDRGQPCDTGLSCQANGSGEEVCLPKSVRGRQLELPSAAEIAETYLEKHRNLLQYCVSPGSRQCGRCAIDPHTWYTYCEQFCGMFRCGRRRMMEETGEEMMNSLVAAMTTYIHMLDFGDDCDPSTIKFGWKIGVGNKKDGLS